VQNLHAYTIQGVTVFHCSHQGDKELRP